MFYTKINTNYLKKNLKIKKFIKITLLYNKKIGRRIED